MKPPWDPALSDGCSVPYFLRKVIPDLRAMCERCRPECLAHDEAYYNGGTIQDFHRANQAFYDGILPKIGVKWATEWYGAVNTLGWSHFGTGRTWNGRQMWHDAGTEAP
jgi:hypothetical protein